MGEVTGRRGRIIGQPQSTDSCWGRALVVILTTILEIGNGERKLGLPRRGV